MVYINKITRTVIDSPTPISGGDWILKEEKKTEEPISTNEVVVDEKTESEAEKEKGIDGLTKADIMQELDAFGIKYDKKATKAELYALMVEEQ